LTQISTDAFLDLRHPPRHLGMREATALVAWTAGGLAQHGGLVSWALVLDAG
jgi:hypothetical protein